MNKYFLDILYQLSHETGLKLFPDNNDACKLKMSNDFFIQLEMDPKADQIIAFCKVVDLPIGKFRENVLKHALVANEADEPFTGNLSFISKQGYLAIHQILPLKGISPNFLLQTIIQMSLKAQDWKTALDSGRGGPNLILTPPDAKRPLGLR